MPDQLLRFAAVLRVFALCSALLIATQVASPLVAAAADRDEELTASSADHEAEAGDEAAEAADDPGPAPEDESVAAADDEAAPAEDADSPAEDADQTIGAPADAESEPVAESADEGEPIAEPADVMEAEPVSEPAYGGDEEPVYVEAASVPEPAHTERQMAAPVPIDDQVDDLFLRRLLDAINERRDRNGTQRLAYVPASANSALDGFLAETISRAGWPPPCSHEIIDGAFAWDYVMAAGFGGDPRGEVLACPSTEPYWTPDRAAEQWWDSPIHFNVLYADDSATSIACSAYGVRGGANEGKKKRNGGGTQDAASAVICVTFRG